MAKIRYIEDKEGGIVLPVTHERGVIDSSGTTLEAKLGGKQATLVSGENIKTINHESLLGPGNIEVAPESIDNVEVSVDANTGTPSASASVSGSTLNLAFHNIKGDEGKQGPQGPQGNTGASVDYPYELVNNLTTDDATKGLSAAQGKVIGDKLSTLAPALKEASGQFVTFDDAAAGTRLSSAVADIDYNAEGVTGATVRATGKNLFGGDALRTQILTGVSGSSAPAEGQARWKSTSSGRIIPNLGWKENTVYTIVLTLYRSTGSTAGTSYSANALLYYTDGSYTKVNYTSAGSGVFVTIAMKTSAAKTFDSIRSANHGGNTTVDCAHCGVFEGNVDLDDFEVYDGEAHVIDWTEAAGTIYGGSLDLTNGKLTSTLAADGTELETPGEYDITPVPLLAKEGVNTIWADTGDTEVKYTVNPLLVSKDRTDELSNEIAGISNELSLVQSLPDRRLTYKRGYYKSDNIHTSESDDWNYAGWLYSPDYIPVKKGDVLTWNHGKNAPTVMMSLYDENKNYVAYYSANTATSRSITISNDSWKFVRISFFKTFNGEPNTTPLLVNGVPYYVDIISKLIYDDEILRPVDDSRGKIGESYPEQTIEIQKYLGYVPGGSNKRFQFLHISDNHGACFGYAQEYLDYSPAKFLINTGDLVLDKFSDKDLSSYQTLTLATQPEKPVFMVLGNHDYSHATSKQDIFDAFIGATNEHNGTTFDKTYYSIDYDTEGVKCIMLDMYDGFSDEELPNLSPSTATAGKMSQTQINWFIGQLQAALSDGLHVCVFIHTFPYDPDESLRINDFCDVLNSDSLGVKSGLIFLPSIIDAFINGDSASFVYNGDEYSCSFASQGHFVAWFGGHTHYDEAGWMKGHTNQFLINVCRPASSAARLGTYDADRLGVHFNFVTVDTNFKRLSIYRVGQQKTLFATERKSFSVFYK